MNKMIILFEYDEDSKQYIDNVRFLTEDRMKILHEFETKECYGVKKYEAFWFDITKLPKELTTIWKGNPYQNWEYHLNFQYHVAETYLERYSFDIPKTMSDVEQQTTYEPNWKKCDHDWESHFWKNRTIYKCKKCGECKD